MALYGDVVKPRLRFGRRVLLRRGWVMALLILSALGHVATIRDWFLPEWIPERWTWLKKVPLLPWEWWAITMLLIVVVIVLEGSFRVVRGLERQAGRGAALRLTYLLDSGLIMVIVHNDGEGHANDAVLRIASAVPNVIQWKTLPFRLYPIERQQEPHRIPGGSQNHYYFFDPTRGHIVADWTPENAGDWVRLDLSPGDHCELTLEAWAANAALKRGRVIVSKIRTGPYAATLRLAFPGTAVPAMDFPLSTWESLSREQIKRRRARIDGKETRRASLPDGTERAWSISDFDTMQEVNRQFIFQTHPEHERWWIGDPL